MVSITLNEMDIIKRAEGQKFVVGETPNLGGNIAYLVVFSIFLVCHTISCVHYHQWWFLYTWGAGLVLEAIGYAGRIWYHINDTSKTAYIMQSVCITVAPCFLMAGVYYILAQLIKIYGEKYSFLKPMSYSSIFIVCDVLSIFVQGAGGGLAGGSNQSLGRYIIIGGLAFQVFTMTIFQYLWYSFLIKIYKDYRKHGDSVFNPVHAKIRNRPLLRPFIAGTSISVILIFTRSIYKLVDFGMGFSSKLSTNEIYFMILEGMMIALAACIMAILSPGLVYGKHPHLHLKGHKKTERKEFLEENRNQL